jgi:hypothetical protein
MESGDISPDKLVKVYLRIKEARDELKVEFDGVDKGLKEQQEAIKSTLLDYCQTRNLDSVKTTEGLFYRSVQKNYWTSDWDSMNKFVIENDCLDFFVKKLNQNNVKTFLEENPDKLPAGLNAQSTYTLNIRKKK